MKWDIKPKNGVGPLALGANMNQVGEILNKSYPIKGKIIDYNDSFTTENREFGCPICHYRKDILSGIDLRPHVSEVRIDKENPFLIEPKYLMTMFEELNQSVGMYGFGFIVFKNISISAKGLFNGKKFYKPSDDEMSDERSIGVFDAHEFDEELIATLRPIKF